MNWFYSDPHFFHMGILNHGMRPWKHENCNFVIGQKDSCNCKVLEKMSEGLIENHNSMVSKDDNCFMLGDFAFQPNLKKEEIRKVFSRLNGNQIALVGNHDKRKQLEYFGFLPENIHEELIVEIQGVKFLLSHFPYKSAMKEEDKTERPFAFTKDRFDENWKLLPLIHGHVHWAFKLKENCLNVGVDVWNWTPVSEDEIIEIYRDTNGFKTNLEKYNGNGS